MLVTFPEYYRLYEHVKKTEKDGKTEVKSKTHAAGGNDRQDAYLYGHPAGRKKRYRSPADFFPHLLWLCTDESGDPDNCSCKICSPDDLDELIPGAKAKGTPLAASKGEPGTNTASMQRQTSGQGMTKVKQEPSVPTPVQQPQQLIPTLLPHATDADQAIDQQYNSFLYRPGEIIWFKRGAAWGLGAVLRRWRKAQNQDHYTVQPLSHPFGAPPPFVKTSHADLRPWLAWSVPKYTTEALNNMRDSLLYESMDWAGMAQKKYGSGDLEVDGSILAAKTVDCSYTLISSIRSLEIRPGETQTLYNGMFLGAEKVWIGDPLRLAPGTDVLVVQSITEHRIAAKKDVSTYLIGDVYQIQQVRHPNPALPTPAAAASNPQLPRRLTEDLAYRNNLSVPTKGIASYWKLARAGVRIELNEIKGRWYEASLILPILLQPGAFADAASKGEIGEATLYMNSRGDCINANRTHNMPTLPRQNNVRATRREAFGQSVSPATEFRDGIDPPLPDNVDPALEGMGVSQTSMDIDSRFDTADTHHDTDEPHVSQPEPIDDRLNGNGDLDDLMNLDAMDEQGQPDIPGFGQNYSHDSTQQGYY